MQLQVADGYRSALETLARVWAPSRPLSVSAWAERYRRLSATTSSEPGPWRNSRVPYIGQVMDALDHRHPSPIVVMCKSSQSAGSEAALNWIGRTIHQAPGSFLCLFPTDKVARKWVRTRLDTMIATTPELRVRVPLGKRESGGSASTLSEKIYPGGVLFTGSANIPDDVASVSVPNLLLDEVDRMPIVLDDEGDPIDLALRRSTTFPRAKAFFVSTPTTLETSRIWPLWESSTMHRYLVSCPHCSHSQTLEWSGLHWIAGKPKTAVYVCSECAAAIEERQKQELLVNGVWHAGHPEREPDITGFHISGLYTPIGLGDSWAKHAAAWERAKGKPAREQVFFNTRLGLVHRGQNVVVDWKALHERREPFKLRDVPEYVLLITSGTDVQADRLETQLVGWGRGDRAVPLDYVVHYGDPTRPEVWLELDEYLSRELQHPWGARLRIACGLVDAGYLPDSVLAFTRERQNRNIYACRGSTVAARAPIGKPSYVDLRLLGQSDKSGAERYELGVTLLKHWLFEMLRSDAGDSDHPILPADRHFRLSADLGEEYCRQICAETWDAKTNRWIARANYHRNEALDTLIYARAAALHHRVAIHKMRDIDFERAEAGLRSAAPADGRLGQEPIHLRGGFVPTVARVINGDN